MDFFRKNSKSRSVVYEGILVIGGGCDECHKAKHATNSACYDMYDTVKRIVTNMGIGLKVDYTTDPGEAMNFGILETPILAINGELVSFGKVLNEEEITSILKAI